MRRTTQVYIPFMYARRPLTERLADALRAGRHSAGFTVAELADRGGVSPRLVSEFERGIRPHVSLDTAVRLLQLVGVSLDIAEATSALSEEQARAERAEHRRRTWVGEKSTLAAQSAPPAPTAPADRLIAIAQASRLTLDLQRAHREARRVSSAKKPVR